jgi:predicted nucleic acid-binding protein
MSSGNWVQRSAYPSGGVKEHLRDLKSLGLTVLPTEYLAEDALEIALSQKLTAYDACYIAVGAKLGLPLITADKKLVEQVEKGKYDVQWLGDLPWASG